MALPLIFRFGLHAGKKYVVKKYGPKYAKRMAKKRLMKQAKGASALIGAEHAEAGGKQRRK